MKFLNTKSLVGVLCFILGIAFTVGAQRYFIQPKELKQNPITHFKRMDPFFDRVFNDEFFNRAHDPFEEMRRMREGMMKQFNQEEGGGLFDSWYAKKFGGGSLHDIQQREDDHFVYYDISVDGLKQEKVNVKVENGQVSISGQIEKKSDEAGSNFFYSSSFQRSFPAPNKVDPNNAQIEQQKGKLVIKFPKVNS